MDRDDALKLLNGGRESIAEWNRRRKAREQIPGLIGAYLADADLTGADLRGANLSGSNSRWMRTALFPFRNPIACATLYFGGMLRHRCTWSGIA
jgi:uncharacterized protein YjbI with pentapeptide repeats